MKRQILHTHTHTHIYVQRLHVEAAAAANMLPLMAIQRYCNQIRYLLFQVPYIRRYFQTMRVK